MIYRLSLAAQADLRSIWSYTAETWSVSQADQYILLIERACEDLASGKIQGRSAGQYRTGYMRVAVGSHFVFYKMPKSGSVDIIRVLHQRMDLRARLVDKPE